MYTSYSKEFKINSTIHDVKYLFSQTLFYKLFQSHVFFAHDHDFFFDSLHRIQNLKYQ